MHGWNDGWVGLLWMVLVWGAILGVVFVLVRAMTSTPAQGGEHSPPGPFEILDERFARGEISAEEYTERRRALRGSGT
jgi:putative membrane protein